MTDQPLPGPPVKVPHLWSQEALFAKAQRYVEEMLAQPRDDWRFAFWSSLALEFLARSALAHISPALLADSKENWRHLYFALGFSPKTSPFVPKSIDITSVLSRLREILPAFDLTLENFAAGHIAKRNQELHSGATPFDGHVLSTWLPLYYSTAEVLLTSIGQSLEVLCGAEEAKTAAAMIAALRDTSAKAVEQSIKAHKTVWISMTEPDRQEASAQASLWAARHIGHRVRCPACNSTAIVTGEPMEAPNRKLFDDQITETQYHLPSRFECVACRLKISGFAQLNAAGLGEPYKVTREFDAVDYYAPDEDDEYLGYEEDNNEP